MPEVVDTCSVCPRLCRWACPVAEGTAREAAVPANLAAVVRGWRDGRAHDALAVEAATLCTDCGACTDACHLHLDLPGALAEARAALGVSSRPEAVGPVEGEGTFIALIEGVEDWSEALSARLGQPVARWTTADHLGWEGRGHPGWDAHLDALVDAVGGRTVVTSTRPSERVLEAAGIARIALHELLEGPFVPVCGAGAACCGAHGPLAGHHPQDAARLASRAPIEGVWPDTACAAHLRAHGREGIRDVLDVLRAAGEGR